MAYGNREWYMRNWEWCVENQESFMGIGMHGNWEWCEWNWEWCIWQIGISQGERDAWELGMVYGKSGIIFGIEMNSNREWCK